jgi:hypothetical protein
MHDLSNVAVAVNAWSIWLAIDSGDGKPTDWAIVFTNPVAILDESCFVVPLIAVSSSQSFSLAGPPSWMNFRAYGLASSKARATGSTDSKARCDVGVSKVTYYSYEFEEEGTWTLTVMDDCHIW